MGKRGKRRKDKGIASWEVREEGEGSYTEPEDLEARGVNDSQSSLHGFRHLSNSYHITMAMWQA